MESTAKSVDPRNKAGEAFGALPLPSDGIGPQVKARREAKGLGVSELARAVGVSPSLISQIERGQSRPSVATLFSLAKALESPIDDFFTDEEEHTAISTEPISRREITWTGPKKGHHRYVVRSNERPSLDIEGGIRWERLTPASLDSMEFLELTYEPGAQSNEALYTHPGSEMVLVLEGNLDIDIAFDTYKLSPGDSIMFPSSVPHRYANPSDHIMRAITVIWKDEPSRPDAQP